MYGFIVTSLNALRSIGLVPPLTEKLYIRFEIFSLFTNDNIY